MGHPVSAEAPIKSDDTYFNVKSTAGGGVSTSIGSDITLKTENNYFHLESKSHKMIILASKGVIMPSGGQAASRTAGARWQLCARAAALSSLAAHRAPSLAP